MIRDGWPPHRPPAAARGLPCASHLVPTLSVPGNVRTLKAREFLFTCEELAFASLPPEFPRPERRVMWTILQFFWGDPRAHIELQPQVSRGLVELGLHFEGTVEFNDAWAALVAARSSELAGALGDDWELEDWTATWRRLHRTWSFDRLDTGLASEVASGLAVALQTFQPLLAEGAALVPAVPPPARAPEAGGRRDWRRRPAGRR